MSCWTAAVLPDSLDGWTITKTVLWGEPRWLARRYTVSVHIVRQRSRWDLTRYQGGKVIATATTTELPPAIMAALEAV